MRKFLLNNYNVASIKLLGHLLYLEAEFESDIPGEIGMQFEELMYNKMGVENWRILLKLCIEYDYVLFWIQAMDPQNGPKEPWPSPLWNGPNLIMPEDLYEEFIENNPVNVKSKIE